MKSMFDQTIYRGNASLFVLGIFLASCGLASSRPIGVLNQNVCDEGTPCTEGFCDPAGYCLNAGAPRYPILVELVPEAEGSEGLGYFFGPGLPGTIPDVLPLPDPVVVEGNVSSGGVGVVAELTFTDVSSNRASTVTVNTRVSNGVSSYQVTLLPDRRYSLSVRPREADASRLPPLLTELTTTGDDQQRLDVVIPSPVDLETIDGRLLDPNRQPVAGWRVWAASSEGVVQSTVVTTGDNGEFEMLLSPLTPSNIVVRAEPEEPGEVINSLTILSSQLLPDQDGFVSILIPQVTDERSIEGRVLAGSSPAAEAMIEVRADGVVDLTTGVRYSLSRRALAGDDGRYSVSVPRGEFVLTATPGPFFSETFAPGSLTFNTESGAVSDIPLRARVEMSIRAATLDGFGLDGATVRLSPASGSSTRPGGGTTDALGVFEQQLDPAVFDVVVEPAAYTNFAWALCPAVSANQVASIDLAISVPLRFERQLSRNFRGTARVYVALAGRLVSVGSVQVSGGALAILIPTDVPNAGCPN